MGSTSKHYCRSFQPLLTTPHADTQMCDQLPLPGVGFLSVSGWPVQPHERVALVRTQNEIPYHSEHCLKTREHVLISPSPVRVQCIAIAVPLQPQRSSYASSHGQGSLSQCTTPQPPVQEETADHEHYEQLESTFDALLLPLLRQGARRPRETQEMPRMPGDDVLQQRVPESKLAVAQVILSFSLRAFKFACSPVSFARAGSNAASRSATARRTCTPPSSSP